MLMKTVFAQSRTPAPVLKVGELGRLTPGAPMRESSSRAVNHILVPIDFSCHSRTALEYALRLSSQLGAELTLVHVMEQLPYQGEWMSPLQESDFTPSAQHLSEELREWLPEQMSARDPVVKFGKAPDEIAATAKEQGCDLIVMATHGYTGLRHMQLGSVAEHVMRHAACPVLLIRVMEASMPERVHSN